MEVSHRLLNILPLISGQSTKVETCCKICKENEKGVSKKSATWEEGDNFA